MGAEKSLIYFSIGPDLASFCVCKMRVRRLFFFLSSPEAVEARNSLRSMLEYLLADPG